jgi:hypothetical protein
MLECDYEIIYKKSKENVVANYLSRKYDEEGFLFSLYFPMLNWLQAIHQEWSMDAKNG